jgi:hypothetical protein
MKTTLFIKMQSHLEKKNEPGILLKNCRIDRQFRKVFGIPGRHDE